MLPRSRLPFLNPHILLPLSNHALTWRYALRWRSLVAARSLSSVDSVTPWTGAVWLRCPSVFPRVCSDSGPLSQWWHPTIQQPLLSASPPALSLSQHQVVFSSESALHQVAQVLELQLQHQSFQWIFGVDVLYDWLVWSPCCSRDFRVFSSTTISFVYSCHLFLISSASVKSFFYPLLCLSLHEMFSWYLQFS